MSYDEWLLLTLKTPAEVKAYLNEHLADDDVAEVLAVAVRNVAVAYGVGSEEAERLAAALVTLSAVLKAAGLCLVVREVAHG